MHWTALTDTMGNPILTATGAALAAIASVGDLKSRNQSLAFEAFIAVNRSRCRKMMRNRRQGHLDD